MIKVYGQDFIRTARSKGLKENQIFKKHLLRNILSCSIKNFKYNFYFALSGSIFIEYVFQIKGIGYYLLIALKYLDYYLIIGILFMYVIIIALMNFITDIISGILDRRIVYHEINISARLSNLHIRII
jgi:peptide/nickel transport system permease protein